MAVLTHHQLREAFELAGLPVPIGIRGGDTDRTAYPSDEVADNERSRALNKLLDAQPAPPEQAVNPSDPRGEIRTQETLRALGETLERQQADLADQRRFAIDHPGTRVHAPVSEAATPPVAAIIPPRPTPAPPASPAPESLPSEDRERLLRNWVDAALQRPDVVPAVWRPLVSAALAARRIQSPF
jgi:hypothetical protein